MAVTAAMIEAEAGRFALAAANAEDRARLRAVERKMSLGLSRQCRDCGQWVLLWAWPGEAEVCAPCLSTPKEIDR